MKRFYIAEAVTEGYTDKVCDHFADNGKDMKSLITDVIQYSARNPNNDDELAG